MSGLIDVQVSVISDRNKRNFLTVDDEEYLEEISDVYSIVHMESLTDEFINRLGLNPKRYIYSSWATAHLAPIFNMGEAASMDIARECILYEAKFKRKGTRKLYRRLIAVPESYSYDKIIETGHCLYSDVEFQSIREFPFKSLQNLVGITK
ncbi:hypothetical protein C6N01_13205 [Enterococcus faecalis]|uniref:hypothetical protein n=1 Tax=Enterococcus faecalis TaxID=1351 RepID=UPI001363CEA1|nr:hypothetical protein [Enterococcus faecalis]NBJ47165.1 hypothetical protein [Enterococcus faecalis]